MQVIFSACVWIEKSFVMQKLKSYFRLFMATKCCKEKSWMKFMNIFCNLSYFLREFMRPLPLGSSQKSYQDLYLLNSQPLNVTELYFILFVEWMKLCHILFQKITNKHDKMQCWYYPSQVSNCLDFFFFFFLKMSTGPIVIQVENMTIDQHQTCLRRVVLTNFDEAVWLYLKSKIKTYTVMPKLCFRKFVDMFNRPILSLGSVQNWENDVFRTPNLQVEAGRLFNMVISSRRF